MNVPITFPKSNNILLAVRIGQLGAEFLSDVNLRHSLKRTLLRSRDDDTLLLIYVSGTGNPTQTSLMKEKSYHVRQRSSQNTTLQVMFVEGEVPPRSQSPTHPLLTSWQGPVKQFLWWNKYAFISLVQTRSLLKEEEREKFKPFLPLISSLFAAISPRPQTKKAKLRRLLSPCKLHLKWTGGNCRFHFISSNQLQPVPVSFSRHDRQKSPATGLIWTSSCFFELFFGEPT